MVPRVPTLQCMFVGKHIRSKDKLADDLAEQLNFRTKRRGRGNHGSNDDKLVLLFPATLIDLTMYNHFVPVLVVTLQIIVKNDRYCITNMRTNKSTSLVSRTDENGTTSRLYMNRPVMIYLIGPYGLLLVRIPRIVQASFPRLPCIFFQLLFSW